MSTPIRGNAEMSSLPLSDATEEDRVSRDLEHHPDRCMVMPILAVMCSCVMAM